MAYHSGLKLTTMPPQAYVVAYKDKESGLYETNLQADYRGLLKLRYQVGDLNEVKVEIVRRETI